MFMSCVGKYEVKVKFSLNNFNLAFVYVVRGKRGKTIYDGRRVEINHGQGEEENEQWKER